MNRWRHWIPRKRELLPYLQRLTRAREINISDVVCQPFADGDPPIWQTE